MVDHAAVAAGRVGRGAGRRHALPPGPRRLGLAHRRHLRLMGAAPGRPAVTVLVTDMDNTLFDWLEMWQAAFGAMLERLTADSGVPRETLEQEFFAIHQRHGTTEYAFAIQELPSLRARHPPEELPTRYAAAIEAYRTMRRRTLTLYPRRPRHPADDPGRGDARRGLHRVPRLLRRLPGADPRPRRRARLPLLAARPRPPRGPDAVADPALPARALPPPRDGPPPHARRGVEARRLRPARDPARGRRRARPGGLRGRQPRQGRRDGPGRFRDGRLRSIRRRPEPAGLRPAAPGDALVGRDDGPLGGDPRGRRPADSRPVRRLRRAARAH